MQAFLARWMPINASAHGGQLDMLTSWVHWLMAILFVGWSLYFLYVLFKFRAGANPKASHAGAESHFSSYIEAGVAIVEVVLLVGFAIPAWAAWTDIPENTDVFEVRVIGQQFAWNVHYPGPDGVFGRTDITLVDDAFGNPTGLDRSDPAAQDDVVMINQLYLPVDQDIVVNVMSRDVIHSFFLPQMRVKQDAIPGMMTPVHFRAIEATPEESRYPGCVADKNCWEIACAQLCGANHYRMQGFYVVLPQAEFDAWMAQQQAALGNLPSPE
jgi:cytochrome c oxidase subunit 2